MIMANANDKGINRDRIPSRNDKQRHDTGANGDQANYYLFGDKNRD